MTFRQFLSVVEIRTKIISVSTYLLASLYVVTQTGRLDPLVAVLLAVAVLAVDMGTTAFNSFYDYARGVDVQGFTVEPDKVLVHEGVAPGHALVTSVALYLIAVVAGGAVAIVSSVWIIPIGVASMAVGFLYNGGPLPISRTPFGEVFAGGFLGSVLFLVIVYAHTGELGAADVYASIPSTLVIAGVLTANNTCDIRGDRAAGRRTLSVLVGARVGSILVDLLTVSPLVLIALPRAADNSLLAVPAAIAGAGTAALLAAMHRRGYSHATKRANMVAVIRIVMIYTAAYAATLAMEIG